MLFVFAYRKGIRQVEIIYSSTRMFEDSSKESTMFKLVTTNISGRISYDSC